MIKIINNAIDNTIQYLDRFYGRKEKVYIHILEESDAVQAPDGKMGFGVFCTENQHIYVAADIPEPEITVPHTIAHEYMHFLQWCEGRPYDEKEADEFAEHILEVISTAEEWEVTDETDGSI